MFFKIIKPSRILENHVKQYWILEMEACELIGNCHRVIPHGLTEMIFNYRDLYKCTSGNDFDIQPRISMSGQKSKFSDVLPADKTGIISVMFYPLGAKQFFPFPLAEIADKSVGLENIFNREIAFLTEKLMEKCNLSQRIELIEEFLIQKLYRNFTADDHLVKESLFLINKHRGFVCLGEMLKKLKTSERQLERKFQSQIGISPKKFIRIIRFQSTIYDFQFNSNQNFTNLGYNNGYYDQSHFIKEFQLFTGYSPKEFFKYPNLYSDYFC